MGFIKNQYFYIFLKKIFNLKKKCKKSDRSQKNSIFGSNLIKKFEDLTIL